MKKRITAALALMVCATSFAVQPPAVTTVICQSNHDKLSRNILVIKEGDKVTVTIGNIKQELTNGSIGGYGDIDLLKKVRSRYASGELFQGLKSPNSSVINDTLTIEYGKDECAFNAVDKRVVRCMKLNGVGVLIESPMTRTVSASGVDINNKFLTIEISIPMRGQFYNGNIKLKDLLISSNIATLNSFSDCR